MDESQEMYMYIGAALATASHFAKDINVGVSVTCDLEAFAVLLNDDLALQERF
jgi:hypothetical protein